MWGPDVRESSHIKVATGESWIIFHTSNFFVDIKSIRIPQTIVKFDLRTREENGILIYNNHTIFICESRIYNESDDWNLLDVSYDMMSGNFDLTELWYGSQIENDYITVIDRFNSDNPKEDLLIMIARVTYWTAFDVEVRILRKYDYGDEYFWEYLISNELIFLPGRRQDYKSVTDLILSQP